MGAVNHTTVAGGVQCATCEWCSNVASYRVTDRVFHNRTGGTVADTYGQPVPRGWTRVRVGDCTCKVPCLGYVCVGCEQRRPWCCGGHPDVRCDHCVANHGTEGAIGGVREL